MGSKGSKPRKGVDHHHLPKVGTAPEREYAQRHERDALAENFGLHPGRGGRARVVTTVLVGLLAVIGVVLFAALVLFD